MRMKILFAVVSLFATLTAGAQKKVGSFTIQPKVGMTISKLTNNPEMFAAVARAIKPDGGLYQNPKPDNTVVSYQGIKEKIGFVVGAEAEYQVSRKFSLSAGVLYSMQGAKYNDFRGENLSVSNAKVVSEYINIPIMANFYVVKGLALKAGLQPAFCVNDEVKGNVMTYDNDEDYRIVTGLGMPNFQKFDLSVPVGMSYEYHNFVIGAMYNLGLTKVFKGNYGDGRETPSSRNSVWQFTLGYKIEL